MVLVPCSVLLPEQDQYFFTPYLLSDQQTSPYQREYLCDFYGPWVILHPASFTSVVFVPSVIYASVCLLSQITSHYGKHFVFFFSLQMSQSNKAEICFIQIESTVSSCLFQGKISLHVTNRHTSKSSSNIFNRKQ